MAKRSNQSKKTEIRVVVTAPDIRLSVGIVAQGDTVKIPTAEYAEICAIDKTAGRDPRLVEA